MTDRWFWRSLVLGEALCLTMLFSLAVPSSGIVEADDGGNRGVAYGLRVRYLVDDHGQSVIYGPDDATITRVDRSGSIWPIVDHAGSTRVNPATEFAPFGQTASPGPDPTYAGHPYDASRQVYQTPARAYDPTIGRFLSTDAGRQQAAPYAYAGNNPIGNVDVTGNIYVPFFLSSGFDRRDRPNASPIVRAVRDALGGARDQEVHPDDDFFNFDDAIRPGGRFETLGVRHLNVGHDDGTNALFHNGNIFWVVGDETPLRMPTDLGETFRRWGALGPNAARNLVVVDTSLRLAHSAPLRQAMADAGIPHEWINVHVLALSPDRVRFVNHQQGVMNMEGFATYTAEIMDQLAIRREHAQGYGRSNREWWLGGQYDDGQIDRDPGTLSPRTSDAFRPPDLWGQYEQFRPPDVLNRRGGATTEPIGRDVVNPGIATLEPFEGDIP